MRNFKINKIYLILSTSFFTTTLAYSMAHGPLYVNKHILNEKLEFKYIIGPNLCTKSMHNQNFNAFRTGNIQLYLSLASTLAGLLSNIIYGINNHQQTQPTQAQLTQAQPTQAQQTQIQANQTQTSLTQKPSPTIQTQAIQTQTAAQISQISPVEPVEPVEPIAPISLSQQTGTPTVVSNAATVVSEIATVLTAANQIFQAIAAN